MRPLIRCGRLQRNVWSGLVRRTHDHRLAAVLGCETQWQPSRLEVAHDRHTKSENRHDHRHQRHDVAETAQPDVDAQRLRACRADRGDDFAALPGDRVQIEHLRERPLISLLAVAGQSALGVIDAEAAGDPFELLSTRVGRFEVALHVSEQRWHLTENVLSVRDVEELSLGGIQVASRPLDPRSVTEHPQPPAGPVRLLAAGGLPGSFEVILTASTKGDVLSSDWLSTAQSHSASSS